MPTFNYSVDVAVDCAKAYSVLKNVTEYSSFMNSVKEVKIISEKDNLLLTQWNVLYDGVPIDWSEEIIYNDKDFSLKFKSVSGNYSRFGIWKVSKNNENNKTSISLEITYDWNAPNFENYFGDVYKQKAERATKGMLYALKKRLSK